jgi:aminoglycoside phosphotransferase (APT) family kinase protein
MSTIGHPLSDLASLTNPFLTADSPLSKGNGREHVAFRRGVTAGLPDRASIVQWYSDEAGWDARPGSIWADAFGIFRSAVITQGIAARYALKQTSSAKAKDYADQMGPYSEFAFELVQDLIAKRKLESKI